MRISFVALLLAVGLFVHVFIVINGAPEIFWIVDLQTALISAAVEMIIAPIILIVGLWKFLIAWHDRPRAPSRDVFKDENQIW